MFIIIFTYFQLFKKIKQLIPTSDIADSMLMILDIHDFDIKIHWPLPILVKIFKNLSSTSRYSSKQLRIHI